MAADVAITLQADEDIQTIPTIGFNVETLQYKNIKFQVPSLSTNMIGGVVVEMRFSDVIWMCFGSLRHSENIFKNIF